MPTRATRLIPCSVKCPCGCDVYPAPLHVFLAVDLHRWILWEPFECLLQLGLRRGGHEWECHSKLHGLPSGLVLCSKRPLADALPCGHIRRIAWPFDVLVLRLVSLLRRWRDCGRLVLADADPVTVADSQCNADSEHYPDGKWHANSYFDRVSKRYWHAEHLWLCHPTGHGDSEFNSVANFKFLGDTVPEWNTYDDSDRQPNKLSKLYSDRITNADCLDDADTKHVPLADVYPKCDGNAQRNAIIEPGVNSISELNSVANFKFFGDTVPEWSTYDESESDPITCRDLVRDPDAQCNAHSQRDGKCNAVSNKLSYW